MRERDADNKIVEEIKDEVISHQLTLTNVPDGTYTRSGVDYAEPAPVGFAAALYASWHPLQYDGTISIEAVEVEHLALPGDVLNIASGLAAWATMAAHIQQVQYNIASGHTSYVIGPAKRIDPDTLLSLMRRVRARMLPLNHICRVSGLATDRGNMIEQGGLGPDKQTSTSAGQRTYLNISPGYDPDAPFNKEIELDPDAIIPSDADDRTDPVVIKPREVKIAVMSNDNEGSIQRVQILSSEAYDQPGTEETPAADGFMLVPRPAGIHPGILAYHPGVGLIWVYSETAKQPLQRGSSDTLIFDWVRGV